LDGAPRIAFASEIQRLGQRALLEQRELFVCHFAHLARAELNKKFAEAVDFSSAQRL
jgi:hypothetical protein